MVRWLCNTNWQYYTKRQTARIQKHSVNLHPVRSGGSIPIVALFERAKNQNNPNGFRFRQMHYLQTNILSF
jgi:hypothetical protein